MNTEQTKGRTGQRLVLVAIALVFFLPIGGSWFIYNFTDIGREAAGGNYGELISPPRLLEDRDLVVAQTSEPRRLHGKWSLVYLTDGDCGQDCRTRLDQMVAARLALGNNSARVQLLLATPAPDTVPALLQFLQGYPNRNVAILAEQAGFAQDAPAATTGRLYLIDPIGNLMMQYSSDSDPEGIIRDLKRLLRYSRIG